MPVSLPSFPAAVPQPAAGEAPASVLSAFSGAASGEPASFDSQMAALSGPAANAETVASDTLNSAPVANSAAVCMRGAVPPPATPAPVVVQEEVALCVGDAAQGLSVETTGDSEGEADVEVEQPDEAAESDEPERVIPDSLIACFVAHPMQAALPVGRDVVCQDAQAAGGADVSAASGRGGHGQLTAGVRAWAVAPGSVDSEPAARAQSTATSVPAAAQMTAENRPAAAPSASGLPVATQQASTTAAAAQDNAGRKVNRRGPSGVAESVATADLPGSTRSAPVLGSSVQPAAAAVPEAVDTRNATSMVGTNLEENSAEVAAADSNALRNNVRAASERKTLNAAGNGLAVERGAAGIAGAKKYRAMISDITSTAGSTTPSAEQSIAGMLSSGRHGMQTSEVAAQETLAPVSKAFEVVQDAVENLKASKKNVVEVNIADGSDAKLSVRIEYRDGVVHTAFRTDSAELREQITRDWQTSMSAYGTSDASVRVADPIFSTTPSAARDSNLDLGGQFARQQQSQQSPSQTTSSAGGLRHAGSGTSSATTSSTAPAATPQSVRPETARYLHTLA